MSSSKMMLSALFALTGLGATAQTVSLKRTNEDCKEVLREGMVSKTLIVADPCMGLTRGEFRITQDTICQANEMQALLVVARTQKSETERDGSFEIKSPHGAWTLLQGTAFPVSLFHEQVPGEMQEDSALMYNFQYVKGSMVAAQTAQTTQITKAIPGCVWLSPAKTFQND